jgi:hypothetical protein
MDAREEALREFLAGTWGAVTRDQAAAAGMCRRATLAFLAELDARDLRDGVTLWHLSEPRSGGGRGAHGTHWVLGLGDELLDLTARQFDPQAPPVRRGPLQEELDRWQEHEQVDPDDPARWRGDILRREEVHPDWRRLREVGPPGDLPDWPYKHELLDDASPWKRQV